MKEGFRDIRDILKEVGEEEGFTYTEMNHLFKHQKHYINKLQEQEGVYAIFFPFLGTYAINVKQAEREIRGKSKNHYAKFLKKIEVLKKHPKYKKNANAHKRVIGLNRIVRYITRTFETGIEPIKFLYPHRKCWDIVQKYSNNFYKKKDE